jgi:hypothetical protein
MGDQNSSDRREERPADESSFRVEDRRRFDETGSRRQGGEEGAEPPRSEGVELPGGGVLREPAPPAEPELPVSFADLVQPFWLMGLAGLGVLPDPQTNQPSVDLARARAAIETLELLRERTEGHREVDETRLLDQALYELKMQFVGLKERAGGA